jgi:pimeloyl-ACP methyl ester carboxylesterase
MAWGAHDTTGDPGEVGPLWQGDYANRAYDVIPAAGHWVQYEAADVVNRRVLDWFAGPAAPASGEPAPAGPAGESLGDRNR